MAEREYLKLALIKKIEPINWLILLYTITLRFRIGLCGRCLYIDTGLKIPTVCDTIQIDSHAMTLLCRHRRGSLRTNCRFSGGRLAFIRLLSISLAALHCPNSKFWLLLGLFFKAVGLGSSAKDLPLFFILHKLNLPSSLMIFHLPFQSVWFPFRLFLNLSKRSEWRNGWNGQKFHFNRM